MPKVIERQIKKLQTQMMRRSHTTEESESGGASVDVLLNNLSVRASLRSDMVAADFAICRLDCPIAEEEIAKDKDNEKRIEIESSAKVEIFFLFFISSKLKVFACESN